MKIRYEQLKLLKFYLKKIKNLFKFLHFIIQLKKIYLFFKECLKYLKHNEFKNLI